MAQKYVNLSNASGGDGSIGTPWGRAEFKTDFESSNPNDYKLKGKGTINTVYPTFLRGGHTTILESYEDTPAILEISIPCNNYTTLHGIIMTEGYGLTLKRIILQTTSTAGTASLFQIQGIMGGYADFTFENSILIVKNHQACLHRRIGYFYSESGNPYQYTMTFKGCSFISLGYAATIDEDNGNCFLELTDVVVDINSCYFEGYAKAIIRTVEGETQPCVGTYKYNAFYNIIGYVKVNSGDFPITDGGNNLNFNASPSQLAGIGDAMTMTIPNDIRPIVGSVPPNGIRDNGDSALGLVYDIMNIARSYGQPDISAAEYFAASPPITGILAADNPIMQAAFAGHRSSIGTVAVTNPLIQAAFTGHRNRTGLLSLILPHITALFTPDVEDMPPDIPWLTKIENNIKSIIEAIRSVDGYHFDWEICNQEDLAKVTFPAAMVYLEPEEENLDERTGGCGGTYLNKVTFRIHVVGKLSEESSNPNFDMNAVLSKALDDLKKVFGINYHINDNADAFMYRRSVRIRKLNGDIFVPVELDTFWDCTYMQLRNAPDKRTCT